MSEAPVMSPWVMTGSGRAPKWRNTAVLLT